MTEQTKAKKRRRPPVFYAETEVTIDPHDLEVAGWRYVGNDPEAAAPIPPVDVVDVVRTWHDNAHPMPWQWCNEQPCAPVRELGEAWKELAC